MKAFIQDQIRSRKIPGIFKIVLLAAFFWSAASQSQPVVPTALHTFPTPNPSWIKTLVLGKVDGALYGLSFPNSTASATLFTINRDGTGYNVLHTFALPSTDNNPSLPEWPEPVIIQGTDGALYGSTFDGGVAGNSTIFTLHANGSGYTVLADFTNGVDPSPFSLIQGTDGALYGAGAVIFRINTDGTGYTSLHTFTTSEGSRPFGLMQASDGFLYGTCYDDGTNGDLGTVFKINTNGTGFAVLHTFGAVGDGIHPRGGLVEGSDGALYGTTSVGGTNGNGIVFKLNTGGGGYTVLHSFAGTPVDGANPLGTLVQGIGNVLYGTTFQGGSATNGTIFKFNPDGSGYNVLLSLTNLTAVGCKPFVGLVAGQTQGDTGVFYGANCSSLGGSGGSIFALLINPPASITPVTGPGATNQTVIFWPSWAVNYKLQSTTNIASGNWTTVTDAVPVYGAQVTSTNPATFYRLVSP